jgi:hypothetical protein
MKKGRRTRDPQHLFAHQVWGAGGEAQGMGSVIASLLNPSGSLFNV